MSSSRFHVQTTVDVPADSAGPVTVPEAGSTSHKSGVSDSGVSLSESQVRRVDVRYNRLFAFSDAVAIGLTLILAALVLALMGREPDRSRLVVTALLMFPAWFLIGYVAGLYSLVDLRISHSLADEIGRVTVAATAWSWLLLVARTPLTDGPIPMAGPILRWIMVIPLILLARSLIRAFARRRSWNLQSVALVGEGSEFSAVADRIERHPGWGIDIHASFPLGSEAQEPGRLADAIQLSEVERVILVGGGEDHSGRTRLVNELIERDLMVDLVSGGPETLYPNAVLHDLEGLPVLSVRPSRLRPIDLRIKRAFDVIVSGIGLVLVSPVVAWSAIRIKLDSKGPVFFRQVRCGYRGEEFKMVKLRTMVEDADGMRQELRQATLDQGNDDVMFKLEDDPRITRVGQTLRQWSIDELPQLWNVFIGDMSLVGPRPLPLDEAARATGMFDARTRLRPGIAGPWQALGRSSIPFDDMIRLDYSYVTAWSMAEDIRLLVRTAVAALSRRGAH